MDQQLVNLNDIRAGMDVCDLDGEKVGTVDHVYRLATLADGPRAFRGFLAVKTGLLGLGKHYYVPTSAVDDVTSECVCLGKAKSDPLFTEWESRPGELATAS